MYMWNFIDTIESPAEPVVGYDVQATDGSVGTVESAGHDPDDSYLIVDTGFWIFGKQRLVPAGAVRQINRRERVIFLSVDKATVKDAPDLDADAHRQHDQAWRDRFAAPFLTPKV
ncbi:MAG: PRC domain containing protein [Acidimicrobiaceae bacterium]|nr:PRC domain containing protein [Acidimicrobiaceae bacterium]